MKKMFQRWTFAHFYFLKISVTLKAWNIQFADAQ